MRVGDGWLAEVRLERSGPVSGSVSGSVSAWVRCPAELIPAPGQALAAWLEADTAPLATPLFLQTAAPEGFWAAPPLPSTWSVGTSLRLRGPLGNGFQLPPTARRVALAAVDASPARLLPLIAAALAQDAALALFADGPLPELPTAVEFFPLAALAENLAWADYLALDAPRALLPRLPELLGLAPGDPPPLDGQILIATEMPCLGLGACGACAVTSGRRYRLVCRDGPVLPLHAGLWG
jgi:dihydroorotate dehydrogenase electron transfer subunit